MAFIVNSLTGSLLGNSVGTSSFSTTASFASTASFVVSASYANTSSFAFNLVNAPKTSAIISASSPGIQPSGSLWWNTDDGNMYIQVSGSSGSTYVATMNTVAGSTFGATFRGSYTGSSWTVNHNLGTTSPLIQVYSGSAVMIPATIVSTTANTSTITFASGFSGSVVASTGVGGITTASLALNAVSASFASTASFIPDFEWINAGTCSISAITTAPTKGTTVYDKVRYRKINSTTHEVEFNYAQSVAGGAGSGVYLFSLPTGITWGPGVLTTTSNDTEVYSNRTIITNGQVFVDSGFQQRIVSVIPYDSTRFRIIAANGAGVFSQVSGVYYSISNAGLSYKFSFYTTI